MICILANIFAAGFCFLAAYICHNKRAHYLAFANAAMGAVNVVLAFLLVGLQ